MSKPHKWANPIIFISISMFSTIIAHKLGLIPSQYLGVVGGCVLLVNIIMTFIWYDRE